VRPAAEQALPNAERAAGGVDLRAVHLLDWALLALGLATLIFSCFDFYHFTSNYAGSRGFSAWHDIAGGGFFGWFGVVLPVLGSVVLALALFEPSATFPMDARLIAFYGWAAGMVCELLAIVLHPKFYNTTTNGAVAKLGHGVSFWFILVLTVVGTVVALMRVQQQNLTLAGPLKNLPNIG
jgi:hypothetical protein